MSRDTRWDDADRREGPNDYGRGREAETDFDRERRQQYERLDEAHTVQEPLPAHASGVCPNCGQWQHSSTGDCLNECVRRGFAPNERGSVSPGFARLLLAVCGVAAFVIGAWVLWCAFLLTAGVQP